MAHYATPLVKVSFDGPDVREEALYDLLRASLILSGGLTCANEAPVLSRMDG